MPEMIESRNQDMDMVSCDRQRTGLSIDEVGANGFTSNVVRSYFITRLTAIREGWGSDPHTLFLRGAQSACAIRNLRRARSRRGAGRRRRERRGHRSDRRGRSRTAEFKNSRHQRTHFKQS